MIKTCLSIFLVLFNLFLLQSFTFAQEPTDPSTIKLKSFTPIPTKTPLPTRILVPTAPPGQPTIPNSNSACFLSNRGLSSDCAVVGKSLLNPKPRYLKDTSLCTDAYMYPYYRATFEPPDMVDLRSEIGGEFWVKNAEMPYNKCKIEDLKRMLRYVETHYHCVTFVGYGYRSYQEQEAIWNSKGCATNPLCGAAPPGRSLHQGGIALDLFCAHMNGTQLVLEDIPDDFTGKAGNFNYHRPLPHSDAPHFNGL